MPPSEPSVILSCEHGGNQLPRWIRMAVKPGRRVLESHRGWDPGALELARKFSRSLRAPLFAGQITRLAIDLNRSLENPDAWSKYSTSLPAADRRRLVQGVYTPYRRDVERAIVGIMGASPVLHLSVHSFTPILRGERRTVDIGLLFDPVRKLESALCHRWLRELRRLRPRLRVQFNRPYRGTDDGFTTYLRTKLPGSRYAGVELEVNQRLVRASSAAWNALQEDLIMSLRGALAVTSASRRNMTGDPRSGKAGHS